MTAAGTPTLRRRARRRIAVDALHQMLLGGICHASKHDEEFGDA